MPTITKTQLTKKLGSFVKVKNFENKNQFTIEYQNGEVFQSYETLIGAKINGVLFLSNAHTRSKTTSKHTHLWCGLDRKERERGLKNNEITLIL